MSAQTQDSRINCVTGRALVLRGDDIDTDRIMPARFLRSVSFDGLERHLFEDDRAAAARGGQPHPLDTATGAGAAILIVNRNFGCGSSREHAPQAIVRHGFKAVIGESFAEIFFSNAVALGLPCVVAARDDIQALMAAAESGAGQPVAIDLTTLEAHAGAVGATITLPAPAREAFLTGTWDATALLTADFDAVRAVEARLGYSFSRS